ncbi:MAG: NfeD family protein [Pontiellaceae bacterium]|nr:NfeD family protein [Pontiellaceae bacterium]
MHEWWTGLEGVTRFFYGMAAFFSVFFLWQMVAAFLGLTGDSIDLDHADVDLSNIDGADNFDHQDVIESSQAFKILSLRSIITFFTLFSWGGALYTGSGVPVLKALIISAIWGLVGMIAVTLVFWAMNKLTETGTKDIATSMGQAGTVYLNIPADGFGEIKTTVNGVVEHIKAKSLSGEALPAGTEIRVVKVVDQTLVGVEKLTNKEG